MTIRKISILLKWRQHSFRAPFRINGNYAIAAGLKVADALAIEDSESIGAKTYGNVVAVQEGHESDEKIKALVEALQSDEVKQFMEEKYEGAVVPLF